MKKKLLKLFLKILFILLPNIFFAKADSSFVKTNRFGVHWGWSHWSQPSAGELNNINVFYFASRTPDIGLLFERTFMPKIYYSLGINYMQLNTGLDLQFNRNDFYPWFNSVENGPYSLKSINSNFQYRSIGLSCAMGYEWLNTKSFIIKTAAGINAAHFILRGGSSIWHTELQTINGIQYPIATAFISQPGITTGIRDIFEDRIFVPAVRLSGEIVHKIRKTHVGVGYHVNLGLRKLFRTRDGIDFLPMDPQYRQKTGTEMNFNYWGMRFFVGF